MNKKLFKFILLLMPVFVFQMSALAIDLNEFEDFSSRSLIINSPQSKLNQEQRDYLVEKKLSLNAKCLIEQIKKNNFEHVKFLLECGANPNVSYLAEYPIYIAAKYNRFEMVQLLYKYNAKLDKGFNSELFAAVKNKNEQMAQFLLDRKAKVNYIDSITENSILYYALKNDMIDIAKQLILKGVTVDRKTVMLIKKKKLTELIAK